MNNLTFIQYLQILSDACTISDVLNSYVSTDKSKLKKTWNVTLL